MFLHGRWIGLVLCVFQRRVVTSKVRISVHLRRWFPTRLQIRITRELLKFPLSRRHSIYRTLKVIAMGSQVCKAVICGRNGRSELSKGGRATRVWTVPAAEAAQIHTGRPLVVMNSSFPGAVRPKEMNLKCLHPERRSQCSEVEVFFSSSKELFV